MEFIHEDERKMSAVFVINVCWLFVSLLAFVGGYGFKTFENDVSIEAAELKVQNCHRIIAGEIYDRTNTHD